MWIEVTKLNGNKVILYFGSGGIVEMMQLNGSTQLRTRDDESYFVIESMEDIFEAMGGH